MSQPKQRVERREYVPVFFPARRGSSESRVELATLSDCAEQAWFWLVRWEILMMTAMRQKVMQTARKPSDIKDPGALQSDNELGARCIRFRENIVMVE
jgi:hypothetical protein